MSETTDKAVNTVPENMRWFADQMLLNTPVETLMKNVKTNLKRHLPQIRAFQVRDGAEIMIAGGGPSLAAQLDTIWEKRQAGAKLFALNGAHDYLLANGIMPSAQIIVDAQEHMTRFVQTPRPGIKYLIASQCHPAVFEALKDYDVWIWHSAMDEATGYLNLLTQYYFGNFQVMLGGSTVALRSIWIARAVGFENIHLFGVDSCLMNNEHHAYQQKENDGDEVKTILCADRKFQCSGWMVSQAVEFMDMIKAVGHLFKLQIHGDGLLAHIMQTGAQAFETLETQED